MTSSIMHLCDESDDSLRITSVEVEVELEDCCSNYVNGQIHLRTRS
jgi:hypothetical protein